MSSIASSVLCERKTDVHVLLVARDECWGRLMVALALMSGPSAHVLIGADDAEEEGPNAYAVDIDVMVRDTAAVAERRRADGMVVGRLAFCCVLEKMIAGGRAKNRHFH